MSTKKRQHLYHYDIRLLHKPLYMALKFHLPTSALTLQEEKYLVVASQTSQEVVVWLLCNRSTLIVLLNIIGTSMNRIIRIESISSILEAHHNYKHSCIRTCVNLSCSRFNMESGVLRFVDLCLKLCTEEIKTNSQRWSMWPFSFSLQISDGFDAAMPLRRIWNACMRACLSLQKWSTIQLSSSCQRVPCGAYGYILLFMALPVRLHLSCI